MMGRYVVVDGTSVDLRVKSGGEVVELYIIIGRLGCGGGGSTFVVHCG